MDVLSTLNIAFEFIVVLLVVAGSIGMFTLTHIQRSDKITFILFFIILGISAIFNSLSFGYNGQPGEMAKNIVIVSKFITIATGMLFTAVFNRYLLNLINNKNKWYKIWEITVYVISAILIILLVVNIFTGFLYYVDDNNNYCRGIVFYLTPILEGIVWVVEAVLVLLNRKNLKKQDRYTFVAYLFLLTVATALQIAFPRITFFDLAIIIGIVVLLFGEQSKATERLVEEKIKSEEAKAEEIKTKEKLFRSQVSPHFIYNALTAIQALPDNPDATKRAIGDFAKYLRSTLSTIAETVLIPFEKEIENVQIYLRLEKLRFGKNLKIEYDIKEKDFALPAMSIQILAENAVKHGISVRKTGGTIRISTERIGDEIVITVADNGVGFDVEKQLDGTHIGINNVKNRIQSMVSGELVIESEVGIGTKAIIKIPNKTQLTI